MSVALTVLFVYHDDADHKSFAALRPIHRLPPQKTCRSRIIHTPTHKARETIGRLSLWCCLSKVVKIRDTSLCSNPVLTPVQESKGYLHLFYLNSTTVRGLLFTCDHAKQHGYRHKSHRQSPSLVQPGDIQQGKAQQCT